MCQRLTAQDSLATARLLNSDPQHLLEISQEHGNSITLSGIANFGQRDVREAPGNVQVITARQMEASGAKDLYEALQLVPGLSFALGGDNAIGVGVHGTWAAEGKVLFMLDGKALNENDLGSFNIAERIPLENVDHIEVQLGPGSMMHGGYASLGVVNIVTRSADQGSSSRASVRTGYSADQVTSTLESVSGSFRISRDQDLSYMASFEHGRRSNALRLMPDSSLLNFADSTMMQASSFQLSYRWRGFKATMAYLEESYGVSDAAHSILSRDIILGLQYKVKASRKVDVLLRFNQDAQVPWYRLDTTDPSLLAANTANQRTSALAMMSYK
ncbi:MAG: TonB-dependent receptor plug domain-containing protein, partial [Flavobacteriales bacterium]